MKRKLSLLFMGALFTAIPFMSKAEFYRHEVITITGASGFFNPVNGRTFRVVDLDGIGNPPVVGSVDKDLYASNTSEGFLEELARLFIIQNSIYPGQPYYGPDAKVFSTPGFALELYDTPFDAGLSLLLGAGAVAAMKRARNRKNKAAALA
ncbi:hypothetical protein V9K67_05630 [Paraflavisolibacter sp. H34]|uniref:hypothetical protein n=1 Tax=Huijunlia imazamoxiresistens TaxID=3127457 RepID=UPI0030179A5B